MTSEDKGKTHQNRENLLKLSFEKRLVFIGERLEFHPFQKVEKGDNGHSKGEV